MHYGSPRVLRGEREWVRNNIWKDNAWELCKTNERNQASDLRKFRNHEEYKYKKFRSTYNEDKPIQPKIVHS